MMKSSIFSQVQKKKISDDPEFLKLFFLLAILPKLNTKDKKIVFKNNKVNRKVKYKIKNINNIKQKSIRKPNLAKISYSNRFLLKKKRKLFTKVIRNQGNDYLTTTEESELLKKKTKAILREQKRHSFRDKFQNLSRNKLLSKRDFKAAKIYITYMRKNTFVVILAVVGENYMYDTKVIAKYSCGSIGYRNKKKTTDFASEQTIKAAGNYLNYNRYTSIDIIYTSNIPFLNRKILNSIIPSPLYVRSMSLNKNRPQSYVRRKKAQRK